MYAHFGLAIYFCQTLEMQLVNHLSALHLGRGLDLADADRLLRRWFGQSMGSHVQEVSRQLAVREETAATLKQALARRNWLVHHYFRSRVNQLGTIDGIRSIIEELRLYADEFQAVDAALTAETHALMASRGLSPKVVHEISLEWTSSIRRGETPDDFADWHATFGHREPPPPDASNAHTSPAATLPKREPR
jgi:hypothetical protein